MIELTEEQRRELRHSEPVEVRDSVTNETYVILRREEYQRLLREDYDDGPWTNEERDALAAEVDNMLEDDMAIEDES